MCSPRAAKRWAALLDWWEKSERRAKLRQVLRERDGIDPDDVIMDPAGARSPRAHLHRHVSRTATSRRTAR